MSSDYFPSDEFDMMEDMASLFTIPPSVKEADENETNKNLSEKEENIAATPSSSSSSVLENDLTSSLPDDLLCKVTSFLDVKSLLRMGCCNQHFYNLIKRNEAGWEGLCEQLWASKIHAPNFVIEKNKKGINFKQAYVESIKDAKLRQYLTMEELCYDPDAETGTIWSFRFKEAAGADWTSFDPWYNHLPCRKLVFLKDGTIQQYTPPMQEEREATDQQQRIPVGGSLSDPNIEMKFRFIAKPIDFPEKEIGSYLRISVAGREVPTYIVRRSPTKNWGFVMESCWGLFASFELPPRFIPTNDDNDDNINNSSNSNNNHQQQNVREPDQSHHERQQEQGEEPRRRLRRTENGARWVEVQENGEEILESSSPYQRTRSRMPPTTRRRNPDLLLTDDSDLIITNEIQWREAFLYNVGARVLPEGDNAEGDFDVAFRG